MGNRRNASEKKSARLVVKRETLRQLQGLTDGELRAAAGGMWQTNPPSMRTCLPSCNGC